MERRVATLEEKVSQLEAKAQDLEERTRKIERNIHMWSGAIVVLQLILKFLVH